LKKKVDARALAKKWRIAQETISAGPERQTNGKLPGFPAGMTGKQR